MQEEKLSEEIRRTTRESIRPVIGGNLVPTWKTTWLTQEELKEKKKKNKGVVLALRIEVAQRARLQTREANDDWADGGTDGARNR